MTYGLPSTGTTSASTPYTSRMFPAVITSPGVPSECTRPSESRTTRSANLEATFRSWHMASTVIRLSLATSLSIFITWIWW